MVEGRDVFVRSRNAMCSALLEAGVDPLVTGTVMSNLEEMGFYMMQLNARLTRLEDVTRQDARQTAPAQQETTEEKRKPEQKVGL
jgi:hypothetical protein